ncbi:hypothetical protein ACFQQB_19990 [Nonomuraea rubra]|uniref:hypothetical protein n=1 Tax=Nonomuraea rubra TaxID=46180 RepID=UPI00360C5CF2
MGVTRPTTSTAQAALWDGEGAGPLLDWLDIPRRHSATGPATGPAADSAADPGLSGLVLLDLPDHDSIRLSHRLEVDRLVEQVDLLVWVVDPQKYADAALHERYLRPLAGHRDVMVVLLNQVDRLPADAVDRCLRDLRRLLDDDGLPGISVLAVSARTGRGLDDLRALLAERVSERRSWSARLAADITTAAGHLATADPPQAVEGDGGGAVALGRAEPGEVEPAAEAQGGAKRMAGAERALTGTLCAAAGVPVVVEAVAKGHRHRAVVATGWPVTRWIRRFRPDPLRRLRLGGLAPKGRPGGEIVGRTSVPAASAVQRAQVETAVRDVGEVAAAGLPGAWAVAVRQAARSRARSWRTRWTGRWPRRRPSARGGPGGGGP